MTSSGHALRHVTKSEKNVKVPRQITLVRFFHWFDILTLILIMPCIDIFILKGQILREFPDIKKFVIYWKKHDFTKEIHSYVSKAVQKGWI